MFREMRRSRQLLTKEETEEILRNGTNGVLSVLGEDGYPYGVPVSYVYTDGEICFHTAKTGHKIDAIRADSRVSFTVVDRDQIVGSELTTYFRSTIAFGHARILTDPEEKKKALYALCLKYSADYPEKIAHAMEKESAAMEMIAVSIDHLTGKEAIELVRAKKEPS